MNTSSRFIVATHIMSALAMLERASQVCDPMKSDQLSWSVNTNPVVIRRILGLLRKAGLVISQTGPSGGTHLARNAGDITLLDIYEAVEEGDLFHLHYNAPNQECPVGSNIQGCLCSVFGEAETAMKNVLSHKTLDVIARGIMEQSGITKKLASGYTVDELKNNFVVKDGQLVEK